MKKVFGFFAMALTIVACNKIDVTVLEPAEEDNSITITAQLAPKTPISKAVSDAGDGTISVSWAENEHIAVLYEVSSEKKVADATITAVNAGVATISFSVAGGTAENTPCTLVYPLSAAKADNSGVKAYADLLAVQDGSLNANLDVRVGAGTIQVATPGLTVTTQPAPQFALFKFTLTKDGSTAINAKGFAVKNGADAVITTVAPVYPTTSFSSVYVAVPATDSGTSYKFVANDGSKKYTKSISSTAAISSGVFYQTTLNMGAGTAASDVLKATLDFYTANNWSLPTDYTTGTATYSYGGYTITLYGPTGTGYKTVSTGGKNPTYYLLFGKEGAYLSLPSFNWITSKIVTDGRSGASGKVTQNLYVGDDAVSTETTNATASHDYVVADGYQAPGFVYTLKVTNANNTQVTKLYVYSLDLS